ncbi:regulatory protein RecX [Halalkalibacter wakoensis JCM 9140]|uniref:Regulatory protein RecX n=1 Tax=Halalkalibacter wakoensis JCM 9140 TaxID=1236970 RepID=W4Q3T2_9BACI|nr:recombination regulator RecX [Halalkalibacter wakoensis]GAE26378.1 regulatory protein RecX [Halalkalibacter wakoensis JCM 9140]
MAIIAKIQIQQKNKSRYNIFLTKGQSVEYALSVDEDLLLKHGLKKGLEIDEDFLIQLINDDEKKKTYNLAINYLSYRIRSIEEMRQYLVKKEKEPQHIEEVIKQLINEKLLNDEEFAQAYIRSKQLTLMRGPLKLKQELKQKGLRDDTIEQALAQLEEGTQKEQIINWVEKQKNKKTSKMSMAGFKNKLSTQLMTKGYSRQVIVEAMNEVDFTADNEEEWDAIMIQGEKIRQKLKKKYTGWEFTQRLKQQLYQKGFQMDLIEHYIENGESEE